MITVIAALAADGGIGRKGDLLWHLREDLRHFKGLTMGAPVVMGRKTWESLPKRPLPGRRNVVITRNADYIAEGADVVTSLEEGLKLAIPEAEAAGKEVFVIGGGSIYAEVLPMAEALELTEIDAVAEGVDTWFPTINKTEWEEKGRTPGEENGIRYSFVRYERVKDRDNK